MARTIQITAYGGPEQLKLVDLPVGDPGPGEIRIRNHACGLNFIDVYQRTGLYQNPLPLTLGMEGAGIVEAVGEGVAHLKAGDRAAYASNPPGSYSEQRVMPAKNVVRLPEGIAFDTAAGMMLKGMTAQYLLKRTLPVQGLHEGRFRALPRRRWRRGPDRLPVGEGAGPATDRHRRQRLQVPAGARARRGTHVIDYSKEDFVARVKAITGGAGVKVVYDSVGKDTWDGSLNCLRPFGLMASFGNASGPVPQFAPGIAWPQGFAVRDAADPLHAHRHARGESGDGRRPVRGGAQRRREEPHRSALPAGRRGAGSPRPRGTQDHRIDGAAALKRKRASEARRVIRFPSKARAMPGPLRTAPSWGSDRRVSLGAHCPPNL